MVKPCARRSAMSVISEKEATFNLGAGGGRIRSGRLGGVGEQLPSL